ncbi:zinc-binding metallopeptidase [Arachidicoccus terrestris]|uniref:zinc-binding metallopeptidase n=1 Tax=Arachidicoccus terrestris TaxID=2875539 RepID=UPI001CC42369|nr:putative zinc-binding metallopeptidase [Arachidicoccus terrestris]UAY56385.1 putative zinc-binding metallopeptidase [Arachidicoccus terrestris]
MKKSIWQHISVLFLLSTFLCFSCRKDNVVDISDLPGLGGDTWAKTSIDKWVYDTLTVPFNIEVKYKFDEFEQSLTRDLTPPKEERVIPVLRVLKRVWMDTYVQIAGDNFFKSLVPKQIVLVGSASYNSNGTITIGEAEGGKKVLLYEINDLDIAKRDMVIRMMHTVEHEFAHILHQNKLYDPAFKSICPGGDYTAQWANVSAAEAHALGFVTPYASSGYDDDFVETVSTLLVEGQAYFDHLVGEQAADGQQKLRAKEEMVVDYFKTKWNIDFRELQASVYQALDEIVPAPVIPLTTDLGASGQYHSLYFGNADFAGNLHGKFDQTLGQVIEAVKANLHDIPDSLYFRFTHEDTLLLHWRMHPDDGSSSYYLADIRFHMEKNAAGEMTFGPPIIFHNRDGYNGSNANYYKSTMQPFFDYLSSNTFIAKWPNGKPDPYAKTQIGAIYQNDDESSYMQGKLGY